MSDERLCAYCRQRPEEHAYRPFCSERCRMADLGRWLAGDYRVPSTDAEASRDADVAPPGALEEERERD
jgi:endogenous inhibitor of DNA gyrase (YacG/DUF329 family)